MTGVKRKKKSAVCWKIYALRCEDIKLWCLKRFPILEWATNYNVKENLIPDAISGMMLAIQQVTQGTVNEADFHTLNRLNQFIVVFYSCCFI